MDVFKDFLLIWVAIVITVLTTFGLCKLGSNMFDRSPATPISGVNSGGGVRGCNLQGGTVIAENGQYKECKIGEKK